METLVSGKQIEVEAEGGPTDCYPQVELETSRGLEDFNQATNGQQSRHELSLQLSATMRPPIDPRGGPCIPTWARCFRALAIFTIAVRERSRPCRTIRTLDLHRDRDAHLPGRSATLLLLLRMQHLRTTSLYAAHGHGRHEDDDTVSCQRLHFRRVA